MKELAEINKQIEELISRKIDLVLNNNELSKFDKIKYLSNCDYFKRETYIQSVFSDLEEQWEKELKLKYPNQSYFRINDLFVYDKERYRTINLFEELDWKRTECSYEDESEIDILFYYCKEIDGTDTFKMKFKDFVEYVCSWCLENKCIEFTIDW